MFSELALHERLLKALDKQGFEKPTPVQTEAVPAALKGQDLQVSAETGSGKTAAFLLPLLNRMLVDAAPNTATRALILVPTRELARQVLKHCTDLMSFTHLKAGLITGGADLKYQRAVLRKNPEILIATPGRLVEHLSQNSADLSDLEILVLDEADRMLDLGFSEDMLKITEACTADHQTLLFSATLHHKGVAEVARKVLNDAAVITLNRVQDGHSGIHQQIVLADGIKHKKQLMVRLLEKENFQKALVFTNTRDMAGQLGGLLSYHNIRAAVLHGEMEQIERNRVMDLLRRGHIDVLVATDVAARGLDVKGIELVINFDMARKGDDHVHRVGRTGRAGEQGLAISLISQSEWNLMASIERYLKLNFERRDVPGLEGVWKGPKKLKASGKAAGTRKRTDKSKKDRTRKDATGKKGTGEKVKQRHRDRKSIGKRRAPTAQEQRASELGDGFAPFKKRSD